MRLKSLDFASMRCDSIARYSYSIRRPSSVDDRMVISTCRWTSSTLRQNGSEAACTREPNRAGASTVEAFIILLGPLGGSNMDVRTNERLKNFLIIHGYFSTMSEIVTEEPPEPKSCKTYDRRSR